MEAMLISNIIGVIGAILVVVAYALLQFEKTNPRTYTYNLINLSGGVLLFASLVINFNLGSFIIEIVWITVSLYGLYKTYQESNEKKNRSRFKDRS